MLLIVVCASLGMVIQDVLAVLMVQSEARNRGWLTGFFDAGQWIAGISTTTFSVTALQGHNLALKAAVIAGVTAANFAGSLIGVAIGRRYIKESQK